MSDTKKRTFKSQPKYAGPSSKAFWRRIDALPVGIPRDGAFSAACMLSNIEKTTLKMLDIWEQQAFPRRKPSKRSPR